MNWKVGPGMAEYVETGEEWLWKANESSKVTGV